MKELRLGRIMHHCPGYWDNFITYLQKKNNAEFWQGVSVSDIQQELKSWNGRYYFENDENGIVEFNTEMDCTLFVLRWS
jgi:hypothetical protein